MVRKKEREGFSVDNDLAKNREAFNVDNELENEPESDNELSAQVSAEKSPWGIGALLIVLFC